MSEQDTRDDGKQAAMDRAALYLLETARRRAEQLGHECVRLEHLLVVVLERHLAMVERLAPGVDWQARREALRRELSDAAPEDGKSVDEVVKTASELAAREGVEQVRLRHLVMAAVQASGVSLRPADQETAGLRPEHKTRGREVSSTQAVSDVPQRKSGETPILDRFGVDLTERARRGELPPVVGREREIEAMIQILCRSYKRNPLLVGPAGVGKTAIVEGLARRIAAGDVPERLQGVRIVWLQPTSLMAGVHGPSDLEERMRSVLEEASRPDVVLFIDEFHMIVGAAGVPGLNDLAQRLKPALARGDVACVGATTEREYRNYVASDRALERRFHPLRIDELDAAKTLEIIKTLAEKWQAERGVKVPERVLGEIVDLSERYVRNRRFPDKAIDLLDTAIAAAQAQREKELCCERVYEVIQHWAPGAPAGRAETELARRLETLEEYLNTQVLGQPEAASLVASTLMVTVRGFDLDPQRPNGVFVFAGPVGVGKSTMARAIADHLFAGPDKVLTLEMSEYQDEHTVYKLIGSPPGYVGFEEGGELQWVNDNPNCVVVLENIELAHANVLAVFEQIFNSGKIETMRGERVVFSDAIFVMTCDLSTRRRTTIGFGQLPRDDDVEDSVRALLPPSMLELVDAVCPFYPLSQETAVDIVQRILLPRVIEVAGRRGIELQVGQDVVQHLAASGYSRDQGAARLQRTVEVLLMRAVLQAADGSRDGEHSADGRVRLVARMRDGRVVVQRQ